MFTNVGNLIRQAFIYSSYLAPEQDLTDDGAGATLMQIGLQLLNELIIKNNMNSRDLVLLTTQNYTVTANSDTLTLDNWAHILKIRYLLGTIWVSIYQEDLNTFLNQQVIDNSSGLPFTSFLQRTETGYLMRFFMTLNQDYTFEVSGYYQLTPFANIYEPLTGFNQFYEIYFLYELAYRIQAYYQVPHTPYVLKEREDIRKQLADLKQKRLDRRISATSQVGQTGLVPLQVLSVTGGFLPT